MTDTTPEAIHNALMNLRNGIIKLDNLETITARVAELEAMTTVDPTSLVKAALERAARGAELFTGAKHTAFDIEAGTFPKQSYLGDAIAAEVRALASDPAEVAAIIKKAQEYRE